MKSPAEIFAFMETRYLTGVLTQPVVYYFSIGDQKWTVTCKPDGVEALQGRHTSNADCVLKCDPKLFERMVFEGKRPGPLDIARGKIKTSSVEHLKNLQRLFRLGR